MKKYNVDSGTLNTQGRVLRVFVYGTLKRREKNFAAHCFNAVRIHEGWVWGRLFRRHTGTPILSLPRETILAVGSSHADEDVRLQDAEDDGRVVQFAGSAQWLRVRGEVMEFADVEEALKRLDALEGFRPLGDDSLYERFLVRLGEAPHAPVWTYGISRSRRESDYDEANDPTWWEREA